MSGLTERQAAQIQHIVTELAATIPRTAVALHGPTLLVELQAWLHVYESLARRFDALDLSFEALATQAVSVNEEALRLYDLDEIRASLQVPDDLSGVSL